MAVQLTVHLCITEGRGGGGSKHVGSIDGQSGASFGVCSVGEGPLSIGSACMDKSRSSCG